MLGSGLLQGVRFDDPKPDGPGLRRIIGIEFRMPVPTFDSWQVLPLQMREARGRAQTLFSSGSPLGLHSATLYQQLLLARLLEEF